MRGALLLAAVLTAGCASDATSPSAVTVIEPIMVDTVDVQIAQSQPVHVSVHVTGVVGDGCATLLPIEVSRAGTQVTVGIRRSRPRDAICSQIARLYDGFIPLGAFAPGSYVVRVNDVPHPFRVD